METNRLIIEKFDSLVSFKENELSDYKKNGLDKKLITALSFKIKNYKLVLTILKEYNEPIVSGKQLSDIKGVGKSTVEKINEIINTGVLKEVDEYDLDKHNQFVQDNTTLDIEYIKKVQDLQKINGIGPSKAEKLVSQNITLESLLNDWDDIKNDPGKINHHSIIKGLTHSQKLGLKYFRDIQERIPREQIIELNNILSDLINEIDENVYWKICGSFRRGKETSGDIDILISREDLSSKEDVLNSNILKLLVENLSVKGILVDDLTKKGDTKYMGICIIPGYPIHRRIDIRCVAYHSYIPALLYFTGSMEENVRLRNIAIKQQYKINEYGFYKIEKDGGTKKEILIHLEKEEDLYDKLGQKFKTPTER